MINNIEITGNGCKIEETFRKYTEKRLGKLDKYLPRGSKKDVVMKVIVSEFGKNKGEKYEISVAMDIPGGKVIAAKDVCSDIFAGVDLIELKLNGQIRRYKLESQPHRQKRNWQKLFIRKK